MSSEIGGSDGGKTTVVEDNKSTESPRPRGILEEMEKIKDDFIIRAFIIFSNSDGQAKEKTVTFPLFYGLAYYTYIDIHNRCRLLCCLSTKTHLDRLSKVIQHQWLLYIGYCYILRMCIIAGAQHSFKTVRFRTTSVHYCYLSLYLLVVGTNSTGTQPSVVDATLLLPIYPQNIIVLRQQMHDIILIYKGRSHFLQKWNIIYCIYSSIIEIRNNLHHDFFYVIP